MLYCSFPPCFSVFQRELGPIWDLRAQWMASSCRLQRGEAEAPLFKTRLLLTGWDVSWRSLSGIEGVRELCNHTRQYYSVEKEGELVMRVGLKLLMANIF